MPVTNPHDVLPDLTEEAVLPNPVKLRDILFHAKLTRIFRWS